MKYIVMDCETTGLDENLHQLLTVYMAVVDFSNEGYTIVDEFDVKIKNNTYYVQPGALEVNKIDLIEHHKKTQLSEKNVCEMISRFISNNNAESMPILGQNVHFDINFLKKMFVRNKMKYPLYHRVCDLMGVWLYYLEKTNQNIGVRLKDMCDYFQISYDGAHDAKFDCLLTLQVYDELLKT